VGGETFARPEYSVNTRPNRFNALNNRNEQSHQVFNDNEEFGEQQDTSMEYIQNMGRIGSPDARRL